MKTSLILGTALLCSALTSFAADFNKAKADNWHQWRGPDATGSSNTARPPVTWSEDKNIQWKVPIPGYGNFPF